MCMHSALSVHVWDVRIITHTLPVMYIYNLELRTKQLECFSEIWKHCHMHVSMAMGSMCG